MEGNKSEDLKAIILDAAKSLGYVSLKNEQEIALLAFLHGYDVFISLPTGYGKVFVMLHYQQPLTN